MPYDDPPPIPADHEADKMIDPPKRLTENLGELWRAIRKARLKAAVKPRPEGADD